MRVAIMLRALDEKGGIGVYTANLVEALLDLDADNDYALVYRNPSHVGRFGQRRNVTEHVLTGRSKAIWDQALVPRLCKRIEADVVLHPKFTVPLFGGLPCVMVVHGADWFLPDAAQFYSALDRLYVRMFMPLYLRRAARVISVSRLTTDDFVRIFPFVRDRITTIYFGPARHFGRVVDPAVLADVKARYGLPDRFIFTLTKANGGDRKNIGGVFDAYSRLHGRVPHKLVVGGKGCERFREEYALPKDGWGRDVLFPGWLDQKDLPAIYSASELYLYPSNQEAFPIPITEAMACEVPIVTSKANGLEELAGDAAILVDPRDPDAIAAAAFEVLTKPALAERLRAAGAARSRLYSWDACARSTLALLEDVVTGAKIRRCKRGSG